MWYVVEVKSKFTGRWVYAKSYRTKVSAVKLADKFSLPVRVLKYGSVYDRMADEDLGKVVFQRGEGVFIL